VSSIQVALTLYWRKRFTKYTIHGTLSFVEENQDIFVLLRASVLGGAFSLLNFTELSENYEGKLTDL